MCEPNKYRRLNAWMNSVGKCDWIRNQDSMIESIDIIFYYIDLVEFYRNYAIDFVASTIPFNHHHHNSNENAAAYPWILFETVNKWNVLPFPVRRKALSSTINSFHIIPHLLILFRLVLFCFDCFVKHKKAYFLVLPIFFFSFPP